MAGLLTACKTKNRLPKSFGLRFLLFGLLLIQLVACQSLPKSPHLAKSQHISQKAQLAKSTSTQGILDQALQEQQAKHPNLSGYYPIATGADAFAARSILSDMASKTIDLQYYIWHNDEAGQLMLKDLWEAAERGVVVRLLLDDMNSSAQFDKLLFLLAEHPNIAIRLVNPMSYRQVRSINYFTQLRRLNYRMHNKSMTIDNNLSIIGGRNIGNEYLNNTVSSNFADLDVLLVGPVVKDIASSFEEYWSSPLSYDIQALTGSVTKDITELAHEVVFDDFIQSQQANQNERALRVYRLALQNAQIGKVLLSKNLPFRWTKIELYADPADKLIDNKNQRHRHVVTRLQKTLSQPKHHLSIVSSYFVPTKQGVDTLKKLAKSGVSVNILTNSFDATDVGIVHSGYAHWRKDLLKSGVTLYEIKSHTSATISDNKFWRNNSQSNTSLHAKAFAVDDRVFVGSYNIDPRSANINTELGVLIYDKVFAQRFHQALSPNSKLEQQAYRLALDDQGAILWHTLEDGQPVTYYQEPKTSPFDRGRTKILSWLPIDWLL